jgi:hypothetical protein
MRSLILGSLSQLLGNAENFIVTQILQQVALTPPNPPLNKGRELSSPLVSNVPLYQGGIRGVGARGVVQDVKWLNAIFSVSAPICEGSFYDSGTNRPKN